MVSFQAAALISIRLKALHINSAGYTALAACTVRSIDESTAAAKTMDNQASIQPGIHRALGIRNQVGRVTVIVITASMLGSNKK